MLVTYTQEGQEPQEFTFRPGRLKMSQQAIIERNLSNLVGEKMSFLEFVQDVRVRSPHAVRVLLHWCRMQAQPTTRLEDVDPMGDEVQIRFHRSDLLPLRELVGKIADPKLRAEAFAQLAVELAEAVDAEPDDGEEPGKAGGPSSSPSTPASVSTAGRSRKRGRTTT